MNFAISKQQSTGIRYHARCWFHVSKLAYSVADMLMIDETWTDPTCKDVVLNFGCFHHGVVQECRKS